MTILLPVWRFWPLRVQKTVDKEAMVISPVVGRRGPVLGVTALPASTPITQSVEEFIIDSVYSVFLESLIKMSVDIFFIRGNWQKIQSGISPEREPAISCPTEGL